MQLCSQQNQRAGNFLFKSVQRYFASSLCVCVCVLCYMFDTIVTAARCDCSVRMCELPSVSRSSCSSQCLPELAVHSSALVSQWVTSLFG